MIVAHRRAGKTVATINDLLRGALRDGKKDGRYAYIGPLLNQVKDVAWTYLKQYAQPLLLAGTEPHESELRVDLVGGARVRLYGADNPNRLRGIYFDGVVLDEFADMSPSVWIDVVRPALSDRRGWAVFIGTRRAATPSTTILEHIAAVRQGVHSRVALGGVGPRARVGGLSVSMAVAPLVADDYIR